MSRRRAQRARKVVRKAKNKIKTYTICFCFSTCFFSAIFSWWQNWTWTQWWRELCHSTLYMFSTVAYTFDLKQAVTEKATLRNTFEGRAPSPSRSLKSWSLSVVSTEYTALQICRDMKWGFTGCIAHVDHLRLHLYARVNSLRWCSLRVFPGRWRG